MMHTPGSGECRERAPDRKEQGSVPRRGAEPEAVAPALPLGAEKRDQGQDSDGVEDAGSGSEHGRRRVGGVGAEGQGQGMDGERGRGKREEQRGEESQRWFEAPRVGRSHATTLPWTGLEVRGFGQGVRLDARDNRP